MDLKPASTAQKSFKFRPRLTGVLLLCGACLALTPTALGAGSAAEETAADEAQLSYTSWYLRINEYLFEGRDRKKFIAAVPSRDQEAMV